MNLEFLLGSRGPLAQSYPDYELRPGQLQMARVIEEAIRAGRPAIIEAPTGIGKSYAYLVPALLSGKKVIVSTANKSLQSQLFEKDVPDLIRRLNLQRSFVMVKGRSNYVCHHKWQNYMDEFARVGEEEMPVIGEIRLQLQNPAFDGDVEYLTEPLPAGIATEVVSFPDDCLFDKCRFARDPCYVDTMRDRAAQADLVITNHHLLLTGLLLAHEGRILPEADLYIVDEAHHLEAVATQVFTTEIMSQTLPFLLNRKPFARALNQERIQDLNRQSRSALAEVARTAADNGTLTGHLDLLTLLGSDLEEAAADMERAPAAQQMLPAADEAAQSEHEVAIDALKALAKKIHLMALEDADYVRFAERPRTARSDDVALKRAPIHPAEEIRQLLFPDEGAPVICTSATLTANGAFEHFRRQCGILEQEATELQLTPIFDYASQALLYQPDTQAYDYRQPQAYYDDVAAEIRSLLEITRGDTLCLFTNWRGLEQVAALLGDDDRGVIWPLRAQGEATRRELLEWFRATPHSVLCATRSFWEGIDVPGDALTSVILDKLPFPSPADPIHAQRMQALDAESATGRGRGAFMDYMLPHMALTLKQGFGRLLRRQSDWGVVTILDTRLVRSRYGRLVREDDLPPARFTRAVKDVHAFFAAKRRYRVDYALNVSAPRAADGAPKVEVTVPRDGRHVVLDVPAAPAPTEAQRAVRYLAHSFRQLRQRVESKGGAPSGFCLEVRCPAAWRAAADGPALQAEAAAWRQVHWVDVN